MKDFNYRGKKVKKSHSGGDASYRYGEKTKEIIEEYLTGRREEAIAKYAFLHKQPDVNKIKPFLKKEIYNLNAPLRHFVSYA